MHLKLIQKDNLNKKKAKATGDLIVNKTTDKITKVSRASRQNSSQMKQKILAMICIYVIYKV